ncbi:hypothetical protein D9619_000563 [Psilocybe cf. subviscida]|uniref:tripeptidyl-peptidase II n=1 Tax=Psilocybe cf. subviscida TaxID=2480587 RepID=A0A8H5BF61_9AGAR|nr:hypothetical protein D9619_000563 [Psilocybe cf. subviscida]
MRNFTTLVAFCLVVASSSLASPSAQRNAYQVREEVHSPRGWKQAGKPDPDQPMKLRIGLPQPNFHILEQNLYEVSDPFHGRYGQHLSKEEVEKLVAPHPASLSAVEKWLQEFNFSGADLERSPAKDWITLTVPVSMAEKLLDTTYHVWKHEKSGDEFVRTTSYSLPAHLHEHVDVIQPTTMFGRMKAERSDIFDIEDDSNVKASNYKIANDLAEEPPIYSGGVTNVPVDAACNTTITITCLQQLYNLGNYTASNNPENSVGITGFLEQYANLQDLQSFYAAYRPEAVNSSFAFKAVAGGINNQTLSAAGAEANLDVQYAFGLSYPVPATFYSTAGRPPFKSDIRTPTNTNEPYAEWLDYVLEQESPPLSISTSYGDDEQTVPKSYAIRVCAQIAQLGVRGVSVIFSSGDYGVGDGNSDPETQECMTNDGRNVTRFIPVFPASCPFVTSVGGTAHIPEVAVQNFASGGGFSDYFPRPLYQYVAVEKFLSKLPKGLYAGLYNKKGRAFPDVAAQGTRYRINYRGKVVSISGTSASSPAFAGVVALLNDARLKAKKAPLGFLNPLIYTLGLPGFNDITSGSNPGCGTPGFNASAGWDPVTGVGSPDFQVLKKIVTSPFVL